MTAETPAEQRARILRANPETSPAVYDDLVTLGYQPESWDGMWKIPAVEYPVLWIGRHWALVREVVEQPGTHQAVTTRRGKQKTRWVLRNDR